MISDELKLIKENLEAKGIMHFIDGATEKQIYQFEEKNKIKFPLKYKEWLLFSDGGECFLPAGVQFYGISHKPTIDVQDDNRPSKNYIVIGALSTGDPILCEKDTEKISIYNREAGIIEADEQYKDFFCFLNDLVDILGIGDAADVK